MKLLCILSSVLLLVACNHNEDIDLSEDLQSSVIVHLPFNDESINDISGKKNHMDSLVNCQFETDRHGNENSCLLFDYEENSALSYILKKDVDFLSNLDSWSVTFWYRPIKSLIGQPEIILAQRASTRFDSIGCWSINLFECRQANIRIEDEFIWSSDRSNCFSSHCCDNPATSLEWKNVVVNVGPDEVAIWENGLIGETHCVSMDPNCISPKTIICDRPLFIGLWGDFYLDDLIIFDRILTLEEIASLSNE